MKKWAKISVSLAVLAGVAGPASAHPGAHIHPHGSEGWLAVCAALFVIAVAVYAHVYRSGPKK